MEMDTDADKTIISIDWVERHKIDISPTMVKAQSFSTDVAPQTLLGEFIGSIFINNTLVKKKRFFVARLHAEALLGRDLLYASGILSEIPFLIPLEKKAIGDEEMVTKNSPHTNDPIVEEEKFVHQLTDLLQANEDIPPTASCTQGEIAVELEDSTPTFTRQYPIAAGLHSSMHDTIKDWIARKRVEPCNSSEYNSPLTVIPKYTNGMVSGVRVCVDFRRLNLKVKNEFCSLPNIEDILRSLAGAKIFSEIDLKDAFLQIPVREQDRHLLAFTVAIAGRTQHLQFTHAPFGLKDDKRRYLQNSKRS